MQVVHTRQWRGPPHSSKDSQRLLPKLQAGPLWSHWFFKLLLRVSRTLKEQVTCLTLKVAYPKYVLLHWIFASLDRCMSTWQWPSLLSQTPESLNVSKPSPQGRDACARRARSHDDHQPHRVTRFLQGTFSFQWTKVQRSQAKRKIFQIKKAQLCSYYSDMGWTP